MEPGHSNLVTLYYDELAARKARLFQLYEGERLERTAFGRGNGWTWGYRLFVNDEWATGSSIGEDEIKLFFDIPNVIAAKYCYAVGVAFGLSTFNLALSKADLQVFAIDNYSKRPGAQTDYAQRLVRRLIAEQVPNVRLHVGTSPEEAAVCLRDLPAEEKLSLVFIDGLHTNEAATADFRAIQSYIGPQTVILWHNVYSTKNAFADCWLPELFDQRHVLRTYGVLGVYFNRRVHPGVEAYLRDNCLPWAEWEKNLARLTQGATTSRPSLFRRIWRKV